VKNLPILIIFGTTQLPKEMWRQKHFKSVHSDCKV